MSKANGAKLGECKLDSAPVFDGMIAAKAIAEEGFRYGLPIVMNYAVMYEYAVDTDSGQFRAPSNQIKNSANV